MWVYEEGREILLLCWVFALLWGDQQWKSCCREGPRHRAWCCNFWEKLSAKRCATLDEAETEIWLGGKNKACHWKYRIDFAAGHDEVFYTNKR